MQGQQPPGFSQGRLGSEHKNKAWQMRKGERKQGWRQTMSASADGMHPKLKGWRSCMQSITLSTVLGKEIGICYLLYRWPVQGHQSYNPPYKWEQSPQRYSKAGLAAPIQGRKKKTPAQQHNFWSDSKHALLACSSAEQALPLSPPTFVKPNQLSAVHSFAVYIRYNASLCALWMCRSLQNYMFQLQSNLLL